MKIFKNVSKKVVLLIITVMLLTIPNLNVYSFAGNYHTSSKALTANTNYQSSAMTTEKAALPAVLVGIALGVVAVIGAVDGWNSHHALEPMAFLDFDKNYDEHDFSAYDN